MEELKEKESILVKNKYHILRMPNSVKKAEITKAYISLLQYYSETFDEHDEKLGEKIAKINIDRDCLYKFEKSLFNDTEKSLNKFSPCLISLYHKYRKIIETYKENDYCTHAYYSNNKVDGKKMMKHVYDFFAMLGDDVLDLYEKMAESGNIIACNNLEGCMGYSIDPFPIDNPCVAVQNAQNYFDFYQTIVHEMGHAYQFYLQRNQKKFSFFNPYAEITSHLFEKLFMDYLESINENEYRFSYEEEDYNYFLNEVSISKVLCRLLVNNNIKTIDPYSLAYICYVPLEKLEEEVVNDCGYIISNKHGVELKDFNYSIGKSLAMYFHEKLKNNFDEEWKNYKDFLCTINYLPMNEVLDKYFDVDLVTDNIKRFTKSYHGR